MNPFIHIHIYCTDISEITDDFTVSPFCIVEINSINTQFILSADFYTARNQSEINETDTDIFVDKDTIY